MKKYCGIIAGAFLVILPLFTHRLIAQEGFPYIVNYSLYTLVDKHQTAIEQGPDNLMFFANPKGMITFDGDEWGFIPMNSPVLCMVYDSISAQLYAGCEDDFGFIKKDPKGNYVYHSLAVDGQVSDDVTQVELTSDEVFFAGSKSITAFSRFGNKLKHKWLSETKNPFNGVCRIGKKIFVIINGKEFFELQDESMKAIPGAILLGSSSMVFNCPFDARHTIIGTGDNALFLFDGKKLSSYRVADSSYLRASILTNGISLSSGNLALGTLMGGCMVIEKATGKTIYTLNFNTGLPDDEVFKMGMDQTAGLWISNTYGLSRVDMGMPVKNFSKYQGLSGNISSVVHFNGSVYVGTTEGLYILKEMKEYASREVKVKITEPVSGAVSKKNVKSETPAGDVSSRGETEVQKATGKSSKEAVTEEQTKPRESKGFFARIFSSSSKKQEEPEEIKKTEELKRQQVRFRNEKIYTLQSISHKYQKVEGVNEKCKQLLIVEDRILASTNNGLYEIFAGKAKSVLPGKYVLFISRSSVPGRIYAGTSEGLYSLMLLDGKWETEYHYTELSRTVYSVAESSPGELWLGAENSLYNVKINALGIPTDIRNFSIDSRYAEQVHVKTLNHQLLLFLSSGIYSYSKDSLAPVSSVSEDFFSVPVYLYSESPVVWIRQDGKWRSIADSGIYNPSMDIFLNLFQEIQYISYDEEGNLWVVDNNNQLARIDGSGVQHYNPEFNLFFRNIHCNDELLMNISGISINYGNKSLEFRIVAPYFLRSSTTQYQYRLEGLGNAWSGWTSDPVISFPMLPSGKYTLHVRAKNIFGNVTGEKSVAFRIKPPWWLSYWFIILAFVLLAGIVWLVVVVRTRKLKHDNEVLEQKVKERTAEIERQKDEIQFQNIELAERNEEIMQQKEEIEAQRDEIEAQKNEMEKQRDRIALQNKEITDSIQYAKRIQTAALPSDQYLHHLLPESFVFFRPRDIVSGDFYWMTSKAGKTIIAAADCTGHGVPGAFMSMLGVSLLNEIIMAEGITMPSEILFKLREQIKNTLSRGGQEHETKDGMDLALCTLDPVTRTLEYAGAFNSLYLIRDGQLTEYKADKMPIGIFDNRNIAYTNHSLHYQEGDVLYIFSDGYMDQFGGPEGRKLMSRNFKNLLLSNHQQPMKKQKELLEAYMITWMGINQQQVDDMLVIGMRI